MSEIPGKNRSKNRNINHNSKKQKDETGGFVKKEICEKCGGSNLVQVVHSFNGFNEATEEMERFTMVIGEKCTEC